MSDDREWRCFHCDEVFTDIETARGHFGASELEELGCKFQKQRREEEKGYERGLRDGKALARQWRPIRRAWWFIEYCRYVVRP